MKEKNKQKIATLFLMIAMFLNPLGFDVVQLTLIKLTGSLFYANSVMYCLAVFFFGLYFYFSGSNPIKTIKDIILTVYFDRIHHFFIKKKKNYYSLREVDETDQEV
jgi:hypothetical protein